MRNVRKILDKNKIATVLLVIVLLGNLLFMMGMIHKYEKEKCFNILEDNVEGLTEDIKRSMADNRERLKTFARILAQYEDIRSPEVKEVISSYQSYGAMADLALLFPDNSYYICDGREENLEEDFDFQAEADRGNYISDVLINRLNPEEKILLQAIPIEKNGNAIAVLYGVIRLKNLSEDYYVSCYNGQAEMYMIDAKTGDFIMDTWHTDLRNSEEMRNRKAKRGYSVEKWKQDIEAKQEGMTVFMSQTMGQYFYTYYKPVGINNWMVMLTVPESVVFAELNSLNVIFLISLLLGMAEVAFYFVWISGQSRKEEMERERQLGQIKYMFSVQKLLFDVHHKSDHMELALKKIGQTLRAKNVFFVEIEENRIKESYEWSAASSANRAFIEGRDMAQEFSHLYAILLEEENFLSYTPENLGAEGKILEESGIENLMLSLVRNTEGKAVGLLGALNMDFIWENCRYLDCMVWNFYMALNNMRTHETIEIMASVDFLTGLLNRNRYQKALTEYADREAESVACIYMDINGLHEINNYLGHAAGDDMLQNIAAIFRNTFGKENAYRIGGDEFVCFCFNQTQSAILNSLQVMKKELEKKSYHVSVGVEYSEGGFDIQRLISVAEKKMYQAKREYYQANGDVAKTREMNRKLEEILSKKRDSDTFLSVISSYFKGVYIVNINTDEMRSIYIPVYFEELLERTNQHFLEAFHIYIDAYVAAPYREAMHEMADYEKLEKWFQKEEEVVFHYKKTDGTKLTMRIYKNADYVRGQKETIWLFENERMEWKKG